MKLYFYFLEFSYKEGSYIRFEECEVIEKPKTYYPKEKFPSGFYGSYVSKDSIGKILNNYSLTVILAENTHEVALDLFKKKLEIDIENAEYNAKIAKEKLQVIEKFRKENT